MPAISIAAEVVRATLKNGLRVVIVPNRLAPVVTTEINYLVGSNEAPEGFPGMAHALEHMMFRGSPGLSASQLASIMAAMGGQFNADTQQNVTQYFSTVPANDLDTALHVEAIRMRGLLDSDKLWERERGAIEQEVAQDLSNPMYVFYTRLRERMYDGTPYARTPLGTTASFDRTTTTMLVDFHNTWYTPNNAILIIVGDVDPASTLRSITALFEDIPSRPIPAGLKTNLRPIEPARIELETDLPYGLAIVGYRLPGYDSPDFAAGTVLADVLASKRGDLYALVPAGKALATDFDSDPSRPAAVGTATATFPAGGDGAALLNQMEHIIAGYVDNGVPADLVEAAKRQEIAAAEFGKNSIPGLATIWSTALAIEGRLSPEEDIKAIENVAVDDVNRVARGYLNNVTAVTAILKPRAAGEPTRARAFGSKESFAPQKVVPASLPAWAEATVRGETPPPTAAPTDLRLGNGLRLIVVPSSISPTVTVYGNIRHNADLQTPPGKDGVNDVLDELFSYGTTTLDRLAFQKALDDIAADVSTETAFSLQVLAEHFDRGLELLADNLLHPALPQAAFDVVQEETASTVAGRLKSPDYLARRTLREALLPKGDPELRQATPETVKRLRLDDVKQYYKEVFRPDMTTIVVIGETTPEQARTLVEKYFGAWEAIGPKPMTDLPPVPPNPPSSHIVPDPSRVQDAVFLSQTVGITRQSPDYYTLQVGQHVLSGALYATRLTQDLREKTGLVYTVAAVLESGRTRSAFSVFYGCNPQNVSKARTIIGRDLNTVRRVPVSPVELQQAKTLLIQEIPLARESVDDMAEQLLNLVYNDLALDEPQQAARHYQEITALQVQQAFDKWIRPEGFAQVSLGPTPK
jgi:zinc protease